MRDAATTYIAVQRLADGQRLVRSPLSDPILPAVDVVAVLGEQAPTQSSGSAARNVSRSNKATFIEPLGRVAPRITCVQTFFCTPSNLNICIAR